MDSISDQPRLIVGLGNQGSEYIGTRHNIGFAVLDQLAAQHHFVFKNEMRWKGMFAKHENILYLKPTTFMNLSGESVISVARFYRLPIEKILIVLDDIALPLGRLRLRLSGSAGGHNGLRSILEHFSAQSIPRLRIGVGSAENSDRVVQHVLGRFEPEETAVIRTAIERSAEAISYSLKNGLALAMNLYNKNN